MDGKKYFLYDMMSHPCFWQHLSIAFERLFVPVRINGVALLHFKYPERSEPSTVIENTLVVEEILGLVRVYWDVVATPPFKAGLAGRGLLLSLTTSD
jgi:hypothetical protein